MKESRRGDVKFAANYIGVSESVLNKWACTGGGPEFLKIGRRRIYDTDLLDAFMASRRRKTTSDTGIAA